jgi:hypothetical protein
MAKTIKEQAYNIWIESKGLLDLESVAMLVGCTEDEISTWVYEGEWFKALEQTGIVPMKKEVTKFETHVLPRLKDILQWLKDGMTEYSIAEQLGVSRTTLVDYKSKYLTFRTLYLRAQDERNCLVMNKMYSKATGERVSLLKQKLDKFGTVVDIKEEQYIPPDVNAADLFLRNNSDSYKSAKTDTAGGSITINNYQLPELEAKRAEILSEIQKLEAIEMKPV